MITVCDETAAGQCPVFPGITKRFHWPFRDPEALTGTPAEKLADLRKIRDQIREKVTGTCMGRHNKIFLVLLQEFLHDFSIGIVSRVAADERESIRCKCEKTVNGGTACHIFYIEI